MKNNTNQTVMQELIKWANQYQGKMISADQVILKAYKMLEKEKEQIINAWIANDNELQRLAAEQYYKQTYNNEKRY
jgi:Asp-tRNA(Asn)/Glu-tRNA(Gln) amidotransferase A subunit family amidase